MAAPPPYWKKKTRPCPFYSQGRCLFSDACNFVHSVKVNPESAVGRADSGSGSTTTGNGALALGNVLRDSRPTRPEDVDYINYATSRNTLANAVNMNVDEHDRNAGVGGAETNINVGSPRSLSRSSSERRRRVVLMSPPRSPRMSGLLSALESIIGPDVEEVEIEEEDEDEDGVDVSGELNVEESSLVTTGQRLNNGENEQEDTHSATSSPDSTCLPYCRDSHTSPSDNPPAVSSAEQSAPPTSFSSSHTGKETDSDESDPPHPTSFRSRAPPPIITQHPDFIEGTTAILDDTNTPEVYTSHNQQQQQQQQPNQLLHHTDDPSLTPSCGSSSRRHSTFELLTSPFVPPSRRILSPQLFPVRDPSSSVFGALQQGQGTSRDANDPYGSEEDEEDSYGDVDSLETLESLTEESFRAGSSRSMSQDSLLKECGSEENSGSIETAGTSVECLESIESPHGTERPSSDYFRTPKNHPDMNGGDTAVDMELENLPPLPPSLIRNNDGTERSPAAVEFLIADSLSASSSVPPAVSVTFEDREDSQFLESKVTSMEEMSASPPVIDGSEERRSSSSPKEEQVSVLDDLFRELSASPEQNEDIQTTVEEERPSNTAQFAPMLLNSPEHIAPINTYQTKSDSLDSPGSLSFGISPVSTDRSLSNIVETPVEAEAGGSNVMVHETILERRTKHADGSPKRLAVVSLTSPTKELRESYFPASLEKTVRPTPSPLYDEPQRSASDSSTSSAVSSPRQCWEDLQKKAGVSQKVPFGFRQSLLLEQGEPSSLARKLASQFAQDGPTSRASSVSSLSPVTTFHARPASRTELITGRPRSASPALFVTGSSSHRHSVASHSSSAPSIQIRASANVPHSASQLEFSSKHSMRPDSLTSVRGGPVSSSNRRASWMKPLRLSHVYSHNNSDSRPSSSLSHTTRFSAESIHSSQPHARNASQSLVDNTLLSSSRSSIISAYLNHSSIPPHDQPTIITNAGPGMPSMENVLFSTETINTPVEGNESMHRHSQSTATTDLETTSNLDLLSPLSGSMRGLSFDDLSRFQWPDSGQDTNNSGVNVSVDIPPTQLIPHASRRASLIPPTATLATPTNPSNGSSTLAPCHAIATPRPTLMFAIASDNPAEVERVLASGEARTNDTIGPQSALEFALTNDALVNKTEIVKTLLAFGADPSALSADLRNASDQQISGSEEESDVLTDLPSDTLNTQGSFSKRRKRESVMNPAMKYYLNRAAASPQAAQTSAALRRSDFRPLARMRFDFVGQDRALEHLYWVLGMHSQQPIGTPLVVLCCGPCGHGKSLLARKFGSLLDVPTHTVNMTVLKTSHDLWQCPSMSPYDPPSERTLAEFLEANAGKRCVVVLDEIDKNEDERTLWSLLAPWELGRCSIDSGRRHIDVRNVIWLGTSNIGQDRVFEHQAARSEPDSVMSKAEYRELMNALRPLVTERLGTSLMSRVTAVLPFVPFTHSEKLAIASEAVLSLGGESASELAPEEFERLALQCVDEYVETDGARSLYRSVSTHLMEAF